MSTSQLIFRGWGQFGAARLIPVKGYGASPGTPKVNGISLFSGLSKSGISLANGVTIEDGVTDYE